MAAAIFATNPDAAAGADGGYDFAFRHGNRGMLSIVQVTYLVNHATGDVGLPGIYAIGGFYDGNDFGRLAKPESTRSGNYGVYAMLQQMVYREGGAPSQKGLTVSREATLAPRSSGSAMPFLVGGGLSYVGLVPGRGADILSLGAIYGSFSRDVPRATAETVIEANYQTTVTGWLSITPDLVRRQARWRHLERERVRPGHPADGQFLTSGYPALAILLPAGLVAQEKEWGSVGLPLARNNYERVRHLPSARQRQRQGGKLHRELCRWPPVEVEGIRASEAPLRGRVGKKAREGGGLDPCCNDEDDNTPCGAHSRAFGDLGFQPLDLSSDDETGNALDDETMREMVPDVGAEYDPRFLAIDHESPPALPLARSDEPSVIDREAHCVALFVEETRVHGNDSGIGCGDLLDGAPRRGASGGDQMQLRHVKINLEGVT